MPGAHWRYGFPVSGVAAFDPAVGGVVSAGGVGFDISCGVRCQHTGLNKAEVEPQKHTRVDTQFSRFPRGMGRTGDLRVAPRKIDAMLLGGAEWAVAQGIVGTVQYSHTINGVVARYGIQTCSDRPP